MFNEYKKLLDTLHILAASLLLPLCLLALPLGGLRNPRLWLPAAAAIWLLAVLSPAPRFGLTHKAWSLWLGWMAASFLLGSQPWWSWHGFCRWLTLLVFFGLALEAWNGEKERKRWFYGLMLAAIVLGAGALFLRPAFYPGTSFVIHPMTGFIPPYYNYTVFVEAAFFAACLGVISHAQRPRGKWFGIILAGAIFALALILKARSRGGLLACLVGAVAGVSMNSDARRWWFKGLLLAGLAAALAPQALIEHVIKPDMFEWFKRPYIWRAALEIAGDNPLFGEGIDNFESGFLRHNFPNPWPVRYGFRASRAESDFLGTAAETGWGGLALLLLAIGLSLRAGAPGSGARGPFGAAGLCATLAMSVQCLVDSMLHLPALALLFFSALACANGGSGDASVPRGRSDYWRLFCLLGLVVTTLSFFPRRIVARALELDPAAQDPSDYIRIVENAASIAPAQSYLQEKWAMAWLRLTPPRPDQALKRLEQASVLDPGNALYPMMRAELELSRGGSDSALKLLNRALELEPNFLNARLARAKLWKKKGQTDAAKREMRDILRRQQWLKTAPGSGSGSLSGYDSSILTLSWIDGK